jgi:hypothetical protein
MIEINEEGLHSGYIEYHSNSELDYGILVTDLEGNVVCNSMGRQAVFVVKGPIKLRAACFIGGDYTQVEDIIGHQITIKKVNYE